MKILAIQLDGYPRQNELRIRMARRELDPEQFRNGEIERADM